MNKYCRFFKLAKRNIFHSFICNEVILSISLTIMSVIVERNDNHLIIKDFNTRKDFYEFCQFKIDLWKENYFRSYW